MLQACILLRDAKAVTGCTKDLVGEIAQSLLNVSFLVSPFFLRLNDGLFVMFSSISCWQAGARALAIHERCKGQDQEIEELKKALASKEDDLRVAREACDLYQVDFQRADGERVAAENQAKKAEEDVNTLRATRA